MNFVDPKLTTLSKTYNDITYTTNYFKPAVKITGVTDQSISDWAVGTTYNVGDYVKIPELKRIFRNATASNIGKFPLAYLNTDWVDYGVLNSYAMFATDENIGSKTTGTDCIFEFDFSMSNTIAGTDLDFVSADVLLINTDGVNYKSDYTGGTTYAINDAVIFNNKLWISLQNSNTGNTPDVSPTFWEQNTSRIFFDENILGSYIGVHDFPAYFFDPIVKRTRYVLKGLEWLPSSILRIDFSGAVSIGTIALGREESFGCALEGSKLRHQSTSKIKENTFTGFREIIRYGKIRLLEVDVIYDKELFGSTSQKVERVLDKNIIWLPTEEDIFSEAITLGYIENFDLPMEVSEKTKSSARIVGVST